jgi:transposase-like protein
MKSYETRLEQLKQLASQLENKELTQDIENFLAKWFETYSNISKFLFCSSFIH